MPNPTQSLSSSSALFLLCSHSPPRASARPLIGCCLSSCLHAALFIFSLPPVTFVHSIKAGDRTTTDSFLDLCHSLPHRQWQNQRRWTEPLSMPVAMNMMLGP
ncbi:unnamed protein product [Linum trigynum]|uniref:Secreted protein n=1 Tax=Linum trigynum TaxID=586398 RepID=A0AAV2EC96_9ROSI